MVRDATESGGRKEDLKRQYVGKSIDTLPTPAMLIDRAKMDFNTDEMQKTIDAWNCHFRVHIKTHKTAEATSHQLRNTKNGAIIVSTLAEGWGVLNSKELLTGPSRIQSVLYGVPISIDRISELLRLREGFSKYHVEVLLLVDHVAQVEALQQALEKDSSDSLNVYIKIDSGYRRAGLTVDSPSLPRLIEKITECNRIAIWGVYCHAGHSYSSKEKSEAEAFLGGEIHSVNEAAKIVTQSISKVTSSDQRRHRKPLVLSVGCTPTAHAASNAPSNDYLRQLSKEMNGELELHAGNYSFLDLQQVATGAIAADVVSAIQRCAVTVLGTVISAYPGRASDGVVQTDLKQTATKDDEALCNAGSIALSKDTGPISGYGVVLSPAKYQGWEIARISQEHGVLIFNDKKSPFTTINTTSMLQVGDRIQIIPQHACMVAAAHPHYFIIDSSKGEEDASIVQDVWVPWKGW